MSAAEMRKEIRELSRIHEELGETYLQLCAASDVDPLPVLWQTYPPAPSGHTQAYVMYGYDGETDISGQAGFDVFAESRAELVHAVFLRVLMHRCVN